MVSRAKGGLAAREPTEASDAGKKEGARGGTMRFPHAYRTANGALTKKLVLDGFIEALSLIA